MMYAVRVYVTGLLTRLQSALSQVLCSTGWLGWYWGGFVRTRPCHPKCIECGTPAHDDGG
jgi:hypothetical protein